MTKKQLAKARLPGRPTVITNCGGKVELVIDGVTGFLVPRHDSQAIADKVVYLLNNKEEAEAMGLCGYWSAEVLCNEDDLINQHLSLYEKAIAHRKAEALKASPFKEK